MLTNMKRTEEYSWLKEVDSIALQQSLRDLDKAYKNFFVKRASFPKFKSKHNHNKSYRTQNVGGNISVAGKYIKLPKLGYVKANCFGLDRSEYFFIISVRDELSASLFST